MNNIERLKLIDLMISECEKHEKQLASMAVTLEYMATEGVFYNPVDKDDYNLLKDLEINTVSKTNIWKVCEGIGQLINFNRATLVELKYCKSELTEIIEEDASDY